jgi:hypothetical protein
LRRIACGEQRAFTDHERATRRWVRLAPWTRALVAAHSCAKGARMNGAPGKVHLCSASIPSGAKAPFGSEPFMARLKPCPFEGEHLNQRAPGTNQHAHGTTPVNQLLGRKIAAEWRAPLLVGLHRPEQKERAGDDAEEGGYLRVGHVEVDFGVDADELYQETAEAGEDEVKAGDPADGLVLFGELPDDPEDDQGEE